ncbi:vitamin K epoxide reductase family protein [Lacinutrix sp. Hel_I_90]|uniref:vitamin K epoxide reductase family protein n=1 Tax=Lacinutrix sp. Hel_I_90 TaxID=1249999 RepID=UPI0005C98DB8|nr:vitamin K epoxide reductase family protein [Lacinutrix sp. Hel_I_90]
MKDTLSFLVQALLQNNKIKIDSAELDFQIQSHPSYPSLHAITGVLSHFTIVHTAIRVPVDKNTLEQLPASYIGQIKSEDETEFAFVINKGKKYKIIYSNKKSKTISEAIFLEQFTGVLVAVEKDETKPKQQASTAHFQNPLFGIALVLFTVLFFNSEPSLPASIYFILSLIGVGVSLLIIQHDLGLDSKIIDSICSQESKTTNCNAVLNSKGATLYKHIKLSDVSLIYFVAIGVSSLLLSLTRIPLTTLYLISVMALPVIIYSIYYQVKVSKNWCVLCLGIVSILMFQAVPFFITDVNVSIFSIESILLITFSIFTIAGLWLFISSKLKQEQAFRKLKLESHKFKRNFDLFNTLLKQSKTLNTALTNTPEIVLGNTKAALNIMVITNPFCGHCKGVHHLVESILKQHYNDLSITVRFNINTSNLENNGVLVSSRLLELFHTESEQKCLEAMHEIYSTGEASSWLAKWGKSANASIYGDILEAEYAWCLDNNINFTPEILINGKSYPQAYDRSDLIYFIEDLNETCCTNAQTTQLQDTI